MKKIILVTGNQNKLREAQQILQTELQNIELDLPEIQAVRVEDIIKDKVQRAYNELQEPVMVEDSGLYLAACNDFPGALYKWLHQTLGIEKICELLPAGQRQAICQTCVGLHNGHEWQIFSGDVKGMIATKPQGQSVFGWDPIFIPDGYEKTFAQMTAEEKNAISMRQIALQKAKEFLLANPDFLK